MASSSSRRGRAAAACRLRQRDEAGRMGSLRSGGEEAVVAGSGVGVPIDDRRRQRKLQMTPVVPYGNRGRERASEEKEQRGIEGWAAALLTWGGSDRRLRQRPQAGGLAGAAGKSSAPAPSRSRSDRGGTALAAASEGDLARAGLGWARRAVGLVEALGATWQRMIGCARRRRRAGRWGRDKWPRWRGHARISRRGGGRRLEDDWGTEI